MFADPLVLTATVPTGATATVALTGSGATFLSFFCIGRGPTSSTYRYSISSSHYIDVLLGRQVGKRSRYTVRFTETEIVADLINPELNSVKTSTVYAVADIGVQGTGTNWDKIVQCLASFLYKPTSDTSSLSDLLTGQT